MDYLADQTSFGISGGRVGNFVKFFLDFLLDNFADFLNFTGGGRGRSRGGSD